MYWTTSTFPTPSGRERTSQPNVSRKTRVSYPAWCLQVCSNHGLTLSRHLGRDHGGHFPLHFDAEACRKGDPQQGWPMIEEWTAGRLIPLTETRMTNGPRLPAWERKVLALRRIHQSALSDDRTYTTEQSDLRNTSCACSVSNL